MKYSFIVPVYNVEKYLKKCIESLLNQTYKNFEIIIVNDGSPDNSQEIIEEFTKKYSDKCKGYIKENGGLSDARNFALDKITGDYILFIDSDDYVSSDLLEKINETVSINGEDIIRFPKMMVSEKKEILQKDNINEFTNLDGSSAFIKFRTNKITLETACTYAYKKEFFINNKFKFAKGKIHEDLGIIPYVIMSAQKVSAINEGMYYYVQRENSITNEINPQKDIKKFLDVISHYDFLIKMLEKNKKLLNKKANQMYLQYIAEAVYIKFKKLTKENKKIYRSEINKRNVYKNIYPNSLKGIIKKIVYKFY